MISEIDELRKECKSKDMQIFEMEDEIEAYKTQMREQFQHEKKKLVLEWDEKLRAAVAERTTREQENEELRELITRQHKALQLQN